MALLVATPAASQHPLPQLGMPLFERVDGSDAIVLGRVTALEPGRMRVERVEALAGETQAVFEVKRSPRQPGPHQEGDLAVLFLRGARSPYLATDADRDPVRLADPAATRRFAEATRALIEARQDPARLLDLHLRWLGSSDDTLRELASLTFLLADPPFGALPAQAARDLARAASEPDRPLAERQASALAAARSDAGLEVLLAWIPGAGPASDPLIVRRTLYQAAARTIPGTEAALGRALDHPDPEIRRSALELAARRPGPGIPRERIAEIADHDPDPQIRRRAQRTLERLER